MSPLFATISLFLSAHAAIEDDLVDYCPDGYTDWDTDFSVDPEDWYFGTDYEEWVANGTVPAGYPGMYPAGFHSFTLKRWSEPPICILVDGSRDKKVEILMESPMENVNLCINDASYNGVGNNDIGSVQNCGTGKIYACFTAATATEENEDENFGFYVDCKEGCEDMDIDIWIRVRVSDRSWDQGKTDTSSDLEHWCEGQRGAAVSDSDESSESPHYYYTYPSDLIEDKPSKYPFHIQQIFGRNAGGQTRPNLWAVSLLALTGLACLFA